MHILPKGGKVPSNGTLGAIFPDGGTRMLIGYVKALCEQFDAKPAEIRQLLRGGLNPQRSAELIDEMRVAGLPL